MTKAEERALEVYPKSEKYTTSQRLIINDMRDGFIRGYEQAEKDVKDALLEWANKKLQESADRLDFHANRAYAEVIDKLNSL